MTGMVNVVNMMTGVMSSYSCSPREAVIAAYAQSVGDMNTWDYSEKYGAKVLENEINGRHYVLCGDCCARTD